MSQALLLPVIAFAVGFILILFLAKPTHAGHGVRPEASREVAASD
jgi:hypothetical protein